MTDVSRSGGQAPSWSRNVAVNGLAYVPGASLLLAFHAQVRSAGHLTRLVT